MKTPQDSSNDQLQDLWTSAVLKNVEVPPTLPAHVEAFSQVLKKPHKRPGWVLPSGFVVVTGSVALIAGLVLVRPTASFAAPTLNQVDQAASGAKSYTITLLVSADNSDLYKVVQCRDGARWKSTFGPPTGKPYGQSMMDGKQTVCIQRSRRLTDVLIDGPSKLPNQQWELPTPQNFPSTPSELFRARPGKITVKRGVAWNGRLVDEFESIATIRKGDPKMQLRHVLYADPGSHLPLEMTTTQPNAPQSLREKFTYDYAPLQSSDFEPTIPPGVKVTDVRVERKAVHAAITKNGLVIVDDNSTVGIFLPNSPSITRAAKANKVKLTIDGHIAAIGSPWPVALSNDGRPNEHSHWREMALYFRSATAKQDKLRHMKQVTVRVNGKAFVMRVMRVADAAYEFVFPGKRM